jgi:arginyl-tRNA synthetase
MTSNLFDYFEGTPSPHGAHPPWTARAPGSPNDSFDLILVPRSPEWKDDPDSVQALRQIEAQPWVHTVAHARGTARLRLSDNWIETIGAALEAGGSAEAPLADLIHGQRFAVQFWDPNATKALHAGHLRNLALGNGLAAALTQAGGQVERRSLISDMGRSMGEAMAGVMNSGRYAQGFSDGDEKSDHFVGICYADYVTGRGMSTPGELEEPEDSLTRELHLQDDAADELIKHVLNGELQALELWYKTRAWVISGQRKTLARLRVSFDRVFFESDFLPETAQLTETGLSDGTLTRREDGVVIYATGLKELEELPLVRADGLPTQHMRALVYWMAAPGLEDMTSMQVCGTEWVSHVTCRRKLMDELMTRGIGTPPTPNPGGAAAVPIHPTHDIFHGMVSRQKRALASSEGALLIDDLVEWIDMRIDADPKHREVRRAHPFPERITAQVALGYFLHYPAAVNLDFDPEKLLGSEDSVGWDLVRACAHHGCDRGVGQRPAEDPDYRFAVVQSELYRRYLRLAVDRLEVWPLAHYLKRLIRWYLQSERDEHVERVMQTLLQRSARGLGLEASQ